MSAINNAQCACISAFLLSIGSAAYGAQPPDVVTSDGNGNTAMGSDALLNNSTGDGNTASGDSALNSNTTGSNNTASGIAALQSNTTGVNNTASGFLRSRQQHDRLQQRGDRSRCAPIQLNGSENSAYGEAALWNNTSGNDNNATGLQALFSNTTGGGNIASGLNALHKNTSGSGNIAIGSRETLIYRWCRRCWSLSYGLLDETTDAHRI